VFFSPDGVYKLINKDNEQKKNNGFKQAHGVYY